MTPILPLAQFLGYETIHYIPPMYLMFFPSRINHMNERIQADLMKIMKEKGLLQRPFMLHIFSNSGYANWVYFQRYLKKEVPNSPFNIYYKLQGSVIDSAPCNLDPVVFARGFIGALLPKLTAHKHWFWTPVFEGFFKLFLNLPGNPEKYAELNRLITNTVLPYPQWYLFSSGDTMIYANDIKKHIRQMEKKTRLPSYSLDFETSNHVAHLRTHPTAYSKRIDSILTKVEHNWTTLLEAIGDHSHETTSAPKRTKRLRSKKIKKLRSSKPTL